METIIDMMESWLHQDEENTPETVYYSYMIRRDECIISFKRGTKYEIEKRHQTKWDGDCEIRFSRRSLAGRSNHPRGGILASSKRRKYS